MSMPLLHTVRYRNALPFSCGALFFGLAAVLVVPVLAAEKVTPSEASITPERRATELEPVARVTLARTQAMSWLAGARSYLDIHYADLAKHYKHLHSHPELSYDETQTAAYLLKQLEGTGFQITHGFGGGRGLVAVLRNGDGPTVLVRTEMDALPITEQTGLPYASTVQCRGRDGSMVGVMHACGHDVHMTCWIGTAQTLAQMKDRWSGTLVFIAQPAEELGGGADDMIKAGLFTKFPKPDYCLALHCDPQSAAGTVTYTPGMAMANIDMAQIVVRGKGGHGAWPHMTVDPVVLSARLILDLQTLVSRENNPTDPLVVTVGTIHGGVKANVIPNEVTLQLTIRTAREATRKRVLASIERMARGVAISANAPEPLVSINPNWHTPAVVNDPRLLDSTVSILRDGLGDSHVCQRPPMMGGEDFARFGRAGIASTLLFLGTQSPEKVAAYEQGDENALPSLHSDKFAPVMEPTLKTGVEAMSLAVLNIVGKDSPTRLTMAKTR